MATKNHFLSQITLFPSEEVVPNQFRKAVQVLHSKPSRSLSLVQRRMMNALLKHAIDPKNKPDEQGWFSIPKTVLFKEIDYSSNNQQHLKESARDLMTVVFEWDVMAAEDRRIKWKGSVMFPEVEVRDTSISYQISSQMLPVIKDPSMYAQIDLNIQNRFRRSSSLALWEFCFRYEKLGATKLTEWTLMRDMLLGEKSGYSEYRYFKAKVLKPSIAEVNASSNITIELIEKKEGRFIKELTFIVRRKEEEVKPGTFSDEAQMAFVGEMVSLGVPQSEAKKLLAKFEMARLQQALEYTKARLADERQTKLESPAAYFRSTLENGWGEHQTAPDKRKATSGSRVRDPGAANKLLERYLLEQQTHAKAYFEELDDADKQDLVDRYNAQQQIPALQLKRKLTKAATVAFHGWLAKTTWGDPTQEDLLEFAARIIGTTPP